MEAHRSFDPLRVGGTSRDPVGRAAQLWGLVDWRDNPVSGDALVTWMTAGPNLKEDFEEALVSALPHGSRVFGGRQHYTDGKQRYVALVWCQSYVYWPNIFDRLAEVGGAALQDFLTPVNGRVEEPKLSMVTGYCAKDLDTFGHRWCVTVVEPCRCNRPTYPQLGLPSEHA